MSGGSLRLAGLATLAAGLLLATIARAVEPDVLQSLRNLERSAGGSLRSIVSRHTGAVTVLRANGAGIPLLDASAPAVDRARAFLRLYGPSLKLPDADETAVAASAGPDEAGYEHVRLRQQVHGIPVRYAEMTVHMRGDRLTALLGNTVVDADGIDLTPTITAGMATAAAQSIVRNDYRVNDASFSDPRLELFNRGLLEGTRGTTRLAWFVAATGQLLNAHVWVDAHSGAALFQINQVPDALNRLVYDLNSNPMTPYPGALVGSEGSPPVSPQAAVDVFAYTADTYNYYLSEHGRDSFDGAGATMQSTVRYCDASCGCPCLNAYWNGAHTLFGAPPFSMDDVVGHEWTHGVTQHSAGLVYYKASGALNESYSDIFGETIDLTNGAGYDPPEARWRVAESAAFPPGIRNMMTPGDVPGFDPDKVSSPQFACNAADNYGVHTNSGIGNHAFALMVDGGSFNGFTITGIGLTKAAKVEYRALTQYLTPTSSFQDNYEALLQSCSDLIGTIGITAGDCAEVQKALDAVEMYAAWPCTCGNGVLDAEEECDDGNSIDGDCCSSLCRIASVGDPCSDGDGCTYGDTCQMIGPTLTCVATEGPRTDCRGSTGSATAGIKIKNSMPDKRDRLSFRYRKGVPTAKAEFGDPLGTTDYTFCLYQASQPSPLYRVSLPAGITCKAGRACWKEVRKGYRYRDSTAGRRGVTALTLTEGGAGSAKIAFRARGENLLPPDLGLINSKLTAQIISSTGLCWDAEFPTPPASLTAEVLRDRGE
jgi:cysteine-rich repeat protein